MNANHAMLTTLVGSLLASGAILAFSDAPGIDALPVTASERPVDTTEAALEPASVPQMTSTSRPPAPQGCPACAPGVAEPPQAPLPPEVSAPAEAVRHGAPSAKAVEGAALPGDAAAQPAASHGASEAPTTVAASGPAEPTPGPSLPAVPEASARQGPSPATPRADAPALPEAPRTDEPPQQESDGLRDAQLERSIDARLQSPGATTPGTPDTEVDVPGATLPETCALPGCHEETGFPGADVATPGIESIPLATQDTHVEETRAGPARVDAFDLPTGAHLASTPEVGEGEAHVPAAAVDPACSFAGDACLDEQRVNGTRIHLDGVPAQRVPGGWVWARVDAGAWLDADGAQLHEVEPYRYGVDEVYVGGCDQGCPVAGPSAGYHADHAHAYGIDEA